LEKQLRGSQRRDGSVELDKRSSRTRHVVAGIAKLSAAAFKASSYWLSILLDRYAS
jgi:hypothetical protein